jgi:hypothetical protein
VSAAERLRLLWWNLIGRRLPRRRNPLPAVGRDPRPASMLQPVTFNGEPDDPDFLELELPPKHRGQHQVTGPAVPAGMTPEKLEKIAGYVSILDRMTVDLKNETVTFHPPGDGETAMQDDLRAWAEHLRDAGKGL